MEISKTLFQLSADMAAIEDALWESGGELTPELEEALQETEQGLVNKVDGYGAVVRSFASKEAILDAEIKRLTALKKTAENAQKRIKEHVLDTMGMFGIEKLEGAYCKISRRRTQKVETNDEMMLSGFARSLQEFNDSLPPYLTADIKISKTAIKEMQKTEGILPAGAEIVENWSLIIK